MSDTYLLPCPECEATIEVTVRMAGQDISCGQCGKSTEVPKLGTMRELAIAKSAKDGKRSSGSSNRLASALFSFGALVLVTGAISGFFLNRYAGNMINDIDVEAEVRLRNEQLNEARSFETWDMWGSLEREPIGEYRETDFVVSNSQGRILKNIGYGLFSFAGLGLLTMIASLIMRGK